MRVAELASVRSWLNNHLTASDPLWQRPVAAVSDGEIQLFYARQGLLGHSKQAVEAIDRLQSAVILSVINGEIPEAPAGIILHDLPVDPFFVDDLVEGLVNLSPARRRACLFTLERRIDPVETTGMTWKGAALATQLTPLCREILAASASTRHLRLPYVFWEWSTPIIATPLLELQRSIEGAFSYTWPELVARYRRMLLLHRGADAANLLELAGQF